MAQHELTGFEHIVLGMMVTRPQTGYDLLVFFTRTPAMVYQPSSGTLYPGLRSLKA
jgi:DNA-binding PadR family transcriptional regulator